VVTHLRTAHGLSERRSCGLAGQPRGTQGYRPLERPAERRLIAAMRELAQRHPRYGYRRIAALLRAQGHAVNPKRVLRLWRGEGLLRRCKRRRRVRPPPGGFVRHPAERPHHVWSVDFVSDRTVDGRALRILVVLDECTRRCLGVLVARSIAGGDVRELLTRLVRAHQAPRYLRSDNGPEFRSRALAEGLKGLGVETLFIPPASPWENGHLESFNGKLRDELLRWEHFRSLAEARAMIEAWCRHYNESRPHSALGYLTPARFAARWEERGSATLRRAPPSEEPVPCVS
jgi:transposase InsO family protein